MEFKPKYLAELIIDNVAYEYYSNENYQLALLEQQPSLQLVDVNGVWQLANYPRAHTVTLLPLYKVDVQIPIKKLKQPLHFTLGPHDVTLDALAAKGGEAVIYNGTWNKRPVIIKAYVKRPRTLPWIASQLAGYAPEKYILFEDLFRGFFVVMEQLQDLVYGPNTMNQGLAFLNVLESIGARHGDISNGNIMQDSQGHLKFIDFSRNVTTGTPFYSKGNTDRQALARVLLSYKYRQYFIASPLLHGTDNPTLAKLFRAYLQQLNIISNTTKLTDLIPGPKLKELEKQFFNYFQQTFPQDNESTQLLEMAR